MLIFLIFLVCVAVFCLCISQNTQNNGCKVFGAVLLSISCITFLLGNFYAFDIEYDMLLSTQYQILKGRGFVTYSHTTDEGKILTQKTTDYNTVVNPKSAVVIKMSLKNLFGRTIDELILIK